MNDNFIYDMSTPNRTQNSEKSFSQPLIFGAAFIKEKLVPKRVELVNILQNVQVIELVLLLIFVTIFYPYYYS